MRIHDLLITVPTLFLLSPLALAQNPVSPQGRGPQSGGIPGGPGVGQQMGGQGQARGAQGQAMGEQMRTWGQMQGQGRGVQGRAMGEQLRGQGGPPINPSGGR
ncbi:hypothetical protein L3556_10805 [Candidatus Synechococcus calcipolaris G9]|uniref:Uncharacterized protein n=1 Tax=Candidatus Synechococcus calcipolaris G9 TaxID=1497997 RepID=A0ABT6F0M5_9SYNE|nr:hypothetical protein [Candidatus Synechococcus calcipolaris]MDG2991414.1 hypothetical protein [Candidatus Synechococcus calcipolaris G9]